MTLFARCFLLVFCQLGVGGLLALAIPPFHDLERGFYKSSAGVFFFAALVGGGGTIYLWLTRGSSAIGGFEAALWAAFLLVFGLYLSTLWGDAMLARARLYAAALALGFVALAVSASSLVASPSFALHALSVIDAATSAAALGGVTTGMLIGHWYLIDPGMDIDPFRQCFRFFLWALGIQLVALVAVLGAETLLAPEGASVLALHLDLVAMRLFLGPVAAMGIGIMIYRVLAIPQTMAATGLFYIATLAVLVGEMLGRYFTFRTLLPL
jgi:hypothetical protein